MLKKIILICSIVAFSFAGDMKFADPQPSFDEPRKWVIKLRSANIETVNHMLGSIYNVLKVYPSESINISVIAYAQGMRALRTDYDPHTLSRIRSLMDYDVEFVGCRNTMETMKWEEGEFLEDVTYVQAGIAEVIERIAGGWINVTPY
ncbi:MAG: DsrE family protein [Campylobacterota bacterium]|nr:DsrE family protein [Campylobacterota bacterium]